MPDQLESQPPRPSKAADEIHLLDLLIVLVRYKKLVIGLPVVTGAIAMVASLLMTPIFTSTATLLPPQQQSSGLAAAMLGQLGGLASAAGGIAGLKNPNDLYIGMLQSRSIADALVARFKLKERYEAKTMDDARQALNKVSEIVNGKKDGIISISVEDKDPAFAARLANGYVEELANLTQTMAVSDASMRRIFFEKQLTQAKNQLADAEVALRRTQEKTGMIEPDGQVKTIISAAAQLKATIAAKEVQIASMRTFATAQNPDLLRAHQELRGLQAQLTKLEKNQSGKSTGDFMVPTANLPEVGVEYVRRLRDVKYYETLFDLFAKQYELAKIDEAKDTPLIQQLDKAVPAARRTKPKRALITLAGMMSGAMLGILLAFMRDSYTRSRQNPDSERRWQKLEAAWKKR